MNCSTAPISLLSANTVRKCYVFWAYAQEFAAFMSWTRFTQGMGHPEGRTTGICPFNQVCFPFLNLQGFVLLFPFSFVEDHMFHSVWCFSCVKNAVVTHSCSPPVLNPSSTLQGRGEQSQDGAQQHAGAWMNFECVRWLPSIFCPGVTYITYFPSSGMPWCHTPTQPLSFHWSWAHTLLRYWRS